MVKIYIFKKIHNYSKELLKIQLLFLVLIFGYYFIYINFEKNEFKSKVLIKIFIIIPKN